MSGAQDLGVKPWQSNSIQSSDSLTTCPLRTPFNRLAFAADRLSNRRSIGLNWIVRVQRPGPERPTFNRLRWRNARVTSITATGHAASCLPHGCINWLTDCLAVRMGTKLTVCVLNKCSFSAIYKVKWRCSRTFRDTEFGLWSDIVTWAPLLTTTIVAWIRRSSASVCVCDSVCMFVRAITEKRMIPKTSNLVRGMILG